MKWLRTLRSLKVLLMSLAKQGLSQTGQALLLKPTPSRRDIRQARQKTSWQHPRVTGSLKKSEQSGHTSSARSLTKCPRMSCTRAGGAGGRARPPISSKSMVARPPTTGEAGGAGFCFLEVVNSRHAEPQLDHSSRTRRSRFGGISQIEDYPRTTAVERLRAAWCMQARASVVVHGTFDPSRGNRPRSRATPSSPLARNSIPFRASRMRRRAAGDDRGSQQRLLDVNDVKEQCERSPIPYFPLRCLFHHRSAQCAALCATACSI